MSWDEIMRRVLPPMRDKKTKITHAPGTTSPFGSTNRPKGSTNPHKGVDFNYIGGQQSRLNTSYPALRSPVTGVVTNAGQGDYGRIAIRDANGFTHELLHTHTRHVAVGDPVVAGQLIGTMGNTGVSAPGVEGGKFHVHYQLKDRNGNIVDPSVYWDQQDPIDPAPAPPTLLREYLQYQRRLGSTVGNAFGEAPDAGPLYGPQPVGTVQSSPLSQGQASPPRVTSDVQVRGFANPQTAAGPNVNPAGVFPNELSPTERATSFDDRFGSWSSADGANTPLSPYQLLSPSRPLGIVSGEPMPDYPFPPPIFGGPAPGLEDWAALRRKQASWDRRR